MTHAPRGSIEQSLEELSEWGREPSLNPLDALMWRTERAPADSWTGLVVQLLDRAPEWSRFRRAHEWAISLVPRFAERVVSPYVPTGPPMWSADPSFDLDHHLRRVCLPAPGSMAQLLEVAQTQAVTPLDRRRSPWLAILVEGLEDGRAAYLLQAHHVIMDGAGATQLLSRVLGRTPDRTPAVERPAPPRRVVSPGSVTRQGAHRLVGAAPEATAGLARVMRRAARDPSGTVRYARSMLRVARPATAPVPDLLRGGPRVRWRFGMLECGLPELKAAGRAAGGTVNDAFVSAVLGGIRGYARAQGHLIGDVPISMPVSVRRPDDPMGGNRFTGAFFAAPTGVADAGDRIRAMRERVSAVREEPALDFLNTLTPAFNLAPSAVLTTTLGSLTSAAVLTTSSWPGLTSPAYLAGASMERMFVFGPLPGTSMCAAMCTHVGTCCIAVNVDGDVFTDTDTLWACLRESLDEVLALAV